MYADGDHSHLPVPVCLYISPTIAVKLILHIIIYMGRFETEIDLNLQIIIRLSLRYYKLIGPSFHT